MHGGIAVRWNGEAACWLRIWSTDMAIWACPIWERNPGAVFRSHRWFLRR